MRIYVELDRGGFTEVRGVSGTKAEVKEALQRWAKKYPIIQVLDEHGNRVAYRGEGRTITTTKTKRGV